MRITKRQGIGGIAAGGALLFLQEAAGWGISESLNAIKDGVEMNAVSLQWQDVAGLLCLGIAFWALILPPIKRWWNRPTVRQLIQNHAISNAQSFKMAKDRGDHFHATLHDLDCRLKRLEDDRTK